MRRRPSSFVNDAQAPVAEADAPVRVEAGVVRPGVREQVPHAFERAHVHLSARATRQGYSVNPAHGAPPAAASRGSHRHFPPRHFIVELNPLPAPTGPTIL